jgi:hypothetical protein
MPAILSDNGHSACQAFRTFGHLELHGLPDSNVHGPRTIEHAIDPMAHLLWTRVRTQIH